MRALCEHTLAFHQKTATSTMDLRCSLIFVWLSYVMCTPRSHSKTNPSSAEA